MAKVVAKERLYIIKKYVRARSASEAIEREKKIPVDYCWIDDKDFYMKNCDDFPFAPTI